jgi:hypothetical protein
MNIQLIIDIAICVLLILALVFLLIRRTAAATIAGFSWQRKVLLEHCIWVEESSTSGYPEGSRNQHSEMETYQSYEVVRTEIRTTTDANGNTSTVSQPVYENVTRWRTKYMYEIQRWRKSREELAEGNDHTPYWPSYTLDNSTQERVEKTKETYRVFFRTTSGQTYQHKPPESDWSALDEKATYKLRVTLYGGVTEYVPTQAQSMVMPEQ